MRVVVYSMRVVLLIILLLHAAPLHAQNAAIPPVSIITDTLRSLFPDVDWNHMVITRLCHHSERRILDELEMEDRADIEAIEDIPSCPGVVPDDHPWFFDLVYGVVLGYPEFDRFQSAFIRRSRIDVEDIDSGDWRMMFDRALRVMQRRMVRANQFHLLSEPQAGGTIALVGLNVRGDSMRLRLVMRDTVDRYLRRTGIDTLEVERLDLPSLLAGARIVQLSDGGVERINQARSDEHRWDSAYIEAAGQVLMDRPVENVYSTVMELIRSSTSYRYDVFAIRLAERWKVNVEEMEVTELQNIYQRALTVMRHQAGLPREYYLVVSPSGEKAQVRAIAGVVGSSIDNSQVSLRSLACAERMLRDAGLDAFVRHELDHPSLMQSGKTQTLTRMVDQCPDIIEAMLAFERPSVELLPEQLVPDEPEW